MRHVTFVNLISALLFFVPPLASFIYFYIFLHAIIRPYYTFFTEQIYTLSVHSE